VIPAGDRQILAKPERYNNRFFQTFIVLSYSRMLHDLRNGTIRSRRADWAKAKLDPSWIGLIDRAWAGRSNLELSVRHLADPQDFAGTLEFIQSGYSSHPQTPPPSVPG
jgi:hypothetical protein